MSLPAIYLDHIRILYTLFFFLRSSTKYNIQTPHKPRALVSLGLLLLLHITHIIYICIFIIQLALACGLRPVIISYIPICIKNSLKLAL